MHIPDPVRRLFETRASITVLAVAVATGIMAPLGLGWHQLEILGYIALAALVVEFWVDSGRSTKRLDNVMSERDQAAERAGLAEESALEVAEVRAQVAELESECDRLRDRLGSPAQSLEEVLAGLDAQLGYIGLVEKHRGLKGQGFAQWPVTSIQLRDSNVFVSAHIDNEADRVSGEWVNLVDPAGNVLVDGQTIPTSANQLNAVLQFDYFPEYLRDQLLENAVLPPAGFILRLLGLSFPVYSVLTDRQLTQVRDALGNATRAIGGVLSPLTEEPALPGESEETG